MIIHISKYAMAVLALIALAASSTPAQTEESQTVNQAYPCLSTGLLGSARLAKLPQGVILQSGELKLTQKDINSEIRKYPNELWAQLKKNLFFVLEDKATQSLLLWEAQTWAKDNNVDIKDEDSLISAYFNSLTKGLKVTDAEIKDFYDKNKNMMGDSSFEQVESHIKDYLLGEKREAAIVDYVKNLGQKYAIELDRDWVKKQSSAALNNPIDKARMSGMPSLVDFGSEKCRPCEMMVPVLDFIKKEYAGKLNVVFINTQKDPIAALRFGITSIPVQIFFDKDGKEVFRHVGFFSQEQIKEKLSEMGVK